MAEPGESWWIPLVDEPIGSIVQSIASDENPETSRGTSSRRTGFSRSGRLPYIRSRCISGSGSSSYFDNDVPAYDGLRGGGLGIAALAAEKSRPPSRRPDGRDSAPVAGRRSARATRPTPTTGRSAPTRRPASAFRKFARERRGETRHSRPPKVEGASVRCPEGIAHTSVDACEDRSRRSPALPAVCGSALALVRARARRPREELGPIAPRAPPHAPWAIRMSSGQEAIEPRLTAAADAVAFAARFATRPTLRSRRGRVDDERLGGERRPRRVPGATLRRSSSALVFNGWRSGGERHGGGEVCTPAPGHRARRRRPPASSALSGLRRSRAADPPGPNQQDLRSPMGLRDRALSKKGQRRRHPDAGPSRLS
jgi:hypothetical protein